jgi:hypothetical protein
MGGGDGGFEVVGDDDEYKYKYGFIRNSEGIDLSGDGGGERYDSATWFRSYDAVRICYPVLV